ncbi:hypothetical protein DESAMIL20_1706 [Desulfurella amilsii]|uniref:Flagellar biosynthesis protein FlgN n=1 Tax=Desulfurella amilsii TaxID=1562698 RepID=A0A1X4XX99_9BACT|nr:hypothetical protein [Desulfurella amilsii]OSS42153.1 hypothetical protein DESAMIL20_1706 [Desulfurella amilsii]
MNECLNDYLEAIIENYEHLIELLFKERAYLITMNSNGLLYVLKEKETYLNELTKSLNHIKLMGAQKFQLSKYKSKIIEMSSRFLYENTINAKIAQQHLVFSRSMLNLYTSFMQVNETYNNKAYLPYKPNFNRIV